MAYVSFIYEGPVYSFLVLAFNPCRVLRKVVYRQRGGWR